MAKVFLQVEPVHLLGKPTRRLDALLAEQTTESRSFLQGQIQNGHVRVNGNAVKKPGILVRENDRIEAEWILPPSQAALTPVQGNLQILFEDDELLVLDKPQGLVVHPASSHSGETLVHHLLHHLENEEEFADSDSDRPGIVHRLDKGTSGVLLVAKNRHAQEKLSAQFKDREVKKTYEALVWGTLSGEGRFESSIGRDKANRRKMSSHTQKGRESRTDWKTQTQWKHFSLVRLFPLTGRTHQLRVHLSENKHPIVGDPLYGNGITAHRRKELSPAILTAIEALPGTLLHAAQLQFTHPTTGVKHLFQANRPSVFDSFLEILKKEDL